MPALTLCLQSWVARLWPKFDGFRTLDVGSRGDQLDGDYVNAVTREALKSLTILALTALLPAAACRTIC